MTIKFYNWTVLPQFSQECFTDASYLCSSTALDRTCCKMRQPPSPLTTPLPALTPCDFFLWGFVKYSVYIPPLPMSLNKLCDRITHALQTITADMLHQVWDEFDYHVDVCRVINAWETWTVAAADGVRCACVRWEINFLLTFETAPFFYVYPVYSKIYIDNYILLCVYVSVRVSIYRLINRHTFINT